MKIKTVRKHKSFALESVFRSQYLKKAEAVKPISKKIEEMMRVVDQILSLDKKHRLRWEFIFLADLVENEIKGKTSSGSLYSAKQVTPTPCDEQDGSEPDRSDCDAWADVYIHYKRKKGDWYPLKRHYRRIFLLVSKKTNTCEVFLEHGARSKVSLHDLAVDMKWVLVQRNKSKYKIPNYSCD